MVTRRWLDEYGYWKFNYHIITSTRYNQSLYHTKKQENYKSTKTYASVSYQEIAAKYVAN